MKNTLFILFSFTFSIVFYAQEIIVEGKLYDLASDEPIQDAVIKVLQGRAYTTSEQNGNFTIKADPEAQLEISHLGYITKIVHVKDAIRIAMNPIQYSLNEILISSNSLEDITHSVTVMDEIKQGSQPRNAADLFSDISGFYLQKRSAMSLEPSLRSFKYEQLNIKFDGCAEACNACPNRMDPITAHMTPEEVQKIEVVKGPYSVRFGQTFGGIVNMVTRTKPSKMGLHGNLQSGFETNGSNLMSRAEIQYATKIYDLTLNGEYRDFSDYTDGNGVEVPADFTTISYAIKTGFNPTDKQRILLDWRQKFGKNIDHAGLPMDSPKDNSFIIGLDYQYQDVSDKISSITVKSYHSFVDHIMNNDLRPNLANMEVETPVTATMYGGKIEMILKPSHPWLVYTGLDLDITQRDGNRSRLIKKNMAGVLLDPPVLKIDKVWQDATTRDFGAFVESTYKISDYFSSTAGVRYDFVMGEIKDPAGDTAGSAMGTTAAGFESLYGAGFDKTNEHTIGGNFAIKYHKNKTQLQLAYGLGTRSASMIERYIYHFTVGSDGYEYVGNPFLKPEQNHQIEWAINHKNKIFNVGIALFYSKMKDYISAIYKDNDSDFVKVYSSIYPYAKQFVNVDAHQVGFDAFLNYNLLDNLQLTSNVAYTKAQNESFDEPLAQMAPFIARFGLKYETPKYWIDMRSTLAAKQNRLATSFGETTTTPSYTTLDLRVGYELAKGLKLGASVVNIFDAAYYYHTSFKYTNTVDNVVGDFMYEPGRNFSFFATYNF